MRQIFAFVFCLCFLLFGHAALANFEPVYAPLIADPADALTPAGTAGTTAPPNVVTSPVTIDQQPAIATAPDPVVSPPTTNDQESTTTPLPPSEPSLMNAISRAKDLLAPVLADFKSKEKAIKPLGSKTAATAAALAIWNKSDDSVTIYGGTRGAKYFTADGNGPVIPIVSSAGSQTAYRDNDPNLVVVGTVQGDMVAVTIKKKKVYKPTFAYYVPYNSELYGIETLAAGSDYLSYLIQDAFSDLDAKNILSRAYPGQPLTAIIDPYLIKSIAVIEHADSQIYATGGSEEALGRFLVKLGLNKDDALNTALSVAGARGMVQFIPSTYKLMVTKRPDLALIPDFVKGMADHKNAIKAEAAYLDMILADLPQSVRDIYSADKGAAASYIAAGYNGGSVRVKKAIAVWGDQWSVSHASDYTALTNKAATLKTRIAQIDKKLKLSSTTAAAAKSLKAERAKATSDRATALATIAKIKNTWIVAETAGYVVKLRRVYTMLAAGYFATPNAPANALPGGAVAIAPVALASNNN